MEGLGPKPSPPNLGVGGGWVGEEGGGACMTGNSWWGEERMWGDIFCTAATLVTPLPGFAFLCQLPHCSHHRPNCAVLTHKAPVSCSALCAVLCLCVCYLVSTGFPHEAGCADQRSRAAAHVPWRPGGSAAACSRGLAAVAAAAQAHTAIAAAGCQLTAQVLQLGVQPLQLQG